MMAKTPWTEFRVSGIFAGDRTKILREAAATVYATAHLENVIYLRSKKSRQEPPLFQPVFNLEDMSSRRSNKFLQVADLVTGRTLLIFDDVETIRNYPQSMTRNIINHIAPLTPYKIVAGSDLVTRSLADLYAEFAVLDKRILHASHYWAFAEDHREVSVFDGRTVKANKDPDYLAAKLKPFIHFDLQPQNEVQAQLYAAIQAAPFVDRVQDIADLRLVYE